MTSLYIYTLNVSSFTR